MQSKIGEIYEGKVTGLTAFGAFVRLSNGETGMVHISEVATVYVKDIKDFLKEDQDVKVKVIGINENNKISLSIKQTGEQPKKEQPVHERKSRDGSFQRDGGRRPPKQNPSSSSGPMSFEDMMAKFKQESNEKMSVLKKSTDFKGTNKRGNRQ